MRIEDTTLLPQAQAVLKLSVKDHTVPFNRVHISSTDICCTQQLLRAEASAASLTKRVPVLLPVLPVSSFTGSSLARIGLHVQAAQFNLPVPVSACADWPTEEPLKPVSGSSTSSLRLLVESALDSESVSCTCGKTGCVSPASAQRRLGAHRIHIRDDSTVTRTTSS